MPENKKNKVKFGLKNVHVAPLVVAEDGTVTWEKPFAVPGAVSLSLDPQGETSPFYADNIVYYQSSANTGYSGDLEMALIPDEFRIRILKETMTDTNVLIENADAEPVEFAFIFEFNGDVKATRHVLYRCTCTRPGVSGNTTEGTKDPATDTATLTAVPLDDGRVKAKTTENTDAEVYNGWYDAVFVPEVSA